jgi:hypothetical protein
MEENRGWLARVFELPKSLQQDRWLIYGCQAMAIVPALVAVVYLSRIARQSNGLLDSPLLLVGWLAVLLWISAFHAAIFVVLRFRRLERRSRSLMTFVAKLRDYSVENIEPLRHSLAELQTLKTDDPPDVLNEQVLDAKSDKPLGTRERDTMLKIIIGMAVKGYSYDPAASRSTVPKEVADDLNALGVGVTDDTVRKYLKEAAESVLPASSRRS